MSDEIDRDLLLKELDHIQSILGRYDTFFFVTKNVFVLATGSIIQYYAEEKMNSVKVFALLPILIIGAFLTEYLFRYFYWSGFRLRLKNIQQNVKSFRYQKISYVLKENSDRKNRRKEAFQRFDAIFYGACLLIFLAHVLLRWERFRYAYCSFFLSPQ